MLKKDRSKKKSARRWTRFRHKVVTWIIYPGFFLYVLFRFGRAAGLWKGRKRQYLVLMNHQTSGDQFFVALTFGRALYYVATEDIFSNGLVSAFLRFALNPIPINKTAADFRTVITCMKVAKEGGTIVMAPEGNRTYSGRTCSIKPSGVPLVRKLGLPIAFFRIEGGYGVQPRWADRNRGGRVDFGVSRVMEPEEYAGMSDEMLYGEILKELDVDEARPGGPFPSRRSAEYIERVLYTCPVCGLSRLRSSGRTFSCQKCGLTVEYTDTRELRSGSPDFPFRFAADWYDWQERLVSGLAPGDFLSEPVYTDICKVFEVIICKKKVRLTRGAEVSLYGDRITFRAFDSDLRKTLTFDEIRSIAAMGRNKMNVRTGDTIFQFKGDRRFNPVKYMHFYYHYQNVKGGNANVGGDTEFLGL